MKVKVDLDVCEAYGECVIAAPEVFDLGDDDDTVNVLQDEPDESQREQVEQAVKACPVAAITLED